MTALVTSLEHMGSQLKSGEWQCWDDVTKGIKRH